MKINSYAYCLIWNISLLIASSCLAWHDNNGWWFVLLFFFYASVKEVDDV